MSNFLIFGFGKCISACVNYVRNLRQNLCKQTLRKSWKLRRKRWLIITFSCALPLKIHCNYWIFAESACAAFFTWRHYWPPCSWIFILQQSVQLTTDISLVKDRYKHCKLIFYVVSCNQRDNEIKNCIEIRLILAKLQRFKSVLYLPELWRHNEDDSGEYDSKMRRKQLRLSPISWVVYVWRYGLHCIWI